MSQFVWEPLDFLEFFNVVPEVGKDALSHRYEVIQSPMRLVLFLEQYDGDIRIDLFVEPHTDPVFSFALVGCPGVRFVDDKRGRFLEFAGTKAFGGRYDGSSAIPHGIRVWMEPHIRIEPFACRI